jgi:cellulose biosynthesis protein BcsQ
VKKIVILIGNYCSGKTELAMNMAVLAAGRGLKTQVIDLDRINDYFRMSDHIETLLSRRIDVVSPSFAGKGVTQTVMPARVASAFDGDWDLVIFDVGGDQAGALSLARYHQDFAALEPGQLEVYDIVNVFRPMSESPEKIIKLMGELEGFARQKVTGFVNNSNLLNYASADDLRRGYDVLRETSDMTGIPVVHTTGRKKYLEEFLADGRDPKYIGRPIALETYMHRSWDTFSHGKI